MSVYFIEEEAVQPRKPKIKINISIALTIVTEFIFIFQEFYIMVSFIKDE